MPMPPAADPSISMQKFVVGCWVVAMRKNSCASSMEYGCGKRSRNPSQTRRLFACFASDSASSRRHGRIVQRSSLSSTLFQLFVRFGERFHCKFQVFARVRGADLGANARGAVRHDRIKETNYINTFVEHARGEL